MAKHYTEARNNNNNKHLYKSMRKYGIDKFTVDVLAETEDFKELGRLERYYIDAYDSTNPNKGYNLTFGGESNQYDGNPSAKITVKDVIRIREIYAMGELSCKDCWEIYKDKLSYSGFQKIWDGVTWNGIMPEVYTYDNVEKHRNQKANIGIKNQNSLYSEDEVLNIRKYYVTHTLQETYEKYGDKSKSKVSFRQVLDRTYPNLPMYSKVRKEWHMNQVPIDIDNYKPVSTISVSGE